MKAKNLAAMGSILLLAWHVWSLLADAERYKGNVARYKAAPTLPNLVKLAVAEGVLIGDLTWL